jgi:hypothetical protein
MSDFAGRWLTTFGPMDLTQEGTKVRGWYGPRSDCFLEGKVAGGKLRFRYREPEAAGEGWFVLVHHGKFSGQWRQDLIEQWSSWIGERGFNGVWDTSFGPLRLVQREDSVVGVYEVGGRATIEGRLEGNRLVFRYQEPRTLGEGWFELAADRFEFQGEWRAEGAGRWAPWQGRRRWPAQGIIWLVVIEAYWQLSLADKDFAFGTMLREIFARIPGVEVRQRFFTNEAGLAKWCREVLFLAEPVVLVLATHASQEGLTAGGDVIGPNVLADNLRDADNVRLLHFSSCLLMEQGAAGAFIRSLRERLPFPLSGYATSVDWAASAFIEFTYLDMILARGLEPEDAAKQLPRLLAFAGDKAPADSPFPAAHFRFLKPKKR